MNLGKLGDFAIGVVIAAAIAGNLDPESLGPSVYGQGFMGIASLILKRYADSHPSVQSRAAHTFVWRAIQLSVVGLVVVAVHNTALLAQIA